MKTRAITFLDIAKETDPDCFLYNYARQGELDFGYAMNWRLALMPEGTVFTCFDEHVRFVEASAKALCVATWEPDPDWAVKDQVASMCIEASLAIREGEILDHDLPKVTDRLSALRAQYGVTGSDILEHQRRSQQ